MRRGEILCAVAFVAACELVGIAGSAFTVPAIPAWYASLSKPPFTPPGWLFAPAWTILYALMGVSAYLVWSGRRKKSARPWAKAALAAFAVQLALNLLWSAAFFGARSPAYGMAVIVPLAAAILCCIALFRRVSRAASHLMVPYLLWVVFAAALNLAVLLMN